MKAMNEASRVLAGRKKAEQPPKGGRDLVDRWPEVKFRQVGSLLARPVAKPRTL
ncbi:hypothetical protein LRH25_04355 [Ideonella azotifigens]|nr:hypothetical protein [Ideonella azotifigens]MCD2339569.1 hypothetical protein [Ideonella azotifigens]